MRNENRFIVEKRGPGPITHKCDEAAQCGGKVWASVGLGSEPIPDCIYPKDSILCTGPKI